MRKICTLLLFWITNLVLLTAQNAHFKSRSFTGNYETAIENPSFSETIGRAVPQFLPLAERWENAKNKHKKNTVADFLFVVTIDGLRWQEVFEGADSSLISEIKNQPASYFSKYFMPKPVDRRRLLMPFLWSVFEKQGKIFGNQRFDNQVLVTNRQHISYPGYSEIFCGYADNAHVILNTKKLNPNQNVLEWINRQRGYRGRVAAFGSWELFPFILHEKRSKIEVNAGFEKFTANFNKGLSHRQNKLNELLETTPRHWKDHVRPDSLTWAFAHNYLETKHPKVIFLGFGETDEFAHEGNYAGYLDATARFDSLLAEIWFFIQHDEKYRGKTALLVTTDHGRGRKNWRSHNILNPGSDEIWLAVVSPDIEAGGEIRNPGVIRQEQFAKTMAALIGFDFKCETHPVAACAQAVFEKTGFTPEAVSAEHRPLSDPQTAIQSIRK